MVLGVEDLPHKAQPETLCGLCHQPAGAGEGLPQAWDHLISWRRERRETLSGDEHLAGILLPGGRL